MISYAHLLFALCLLSLNAYAVKVNSFSWQDCGPASYPDHVKSLSVGPDPLTIPGKTFPIVIGTIIYTPIFFRKCHCFNISDHRQCITNRRFRMLISSG